VECFLFLLTDCRNCWPVPSAAAAQDCRNFSGDIVFFYLAFFGWCFFLVAPGVDHRRMINGDKKKIYSALFFWARSVMGFACDLAAVSFLRYLVCGMFPVKYSLYK
jgi:hypothetical protein